MPIKPVIGRAALATDAAARAVRTARAGVPDLRISP
jgi:hypothetical protein